MKNTHGGVLLLVKLQDGVQKKLLAHTKQRIVTRSGSYNEEKRTNEQVGWEGVNNWQVLSEHAFWRVLNIKLHILCLIPFPY